MRKVLVKIAQILPLILVILWSCKEEPKKEMTILHQRPKEYKTLTDYVDPFIGTGGHGHTYPGATCPFGLVQLSPDTRLDGWDGCSGYHYSDSLIYGFSHTHLSGTGCLDYGDILLMPFCNIEKRDLNTAHQLAAPFKHQDELARPGYYKVTLQDRGVIAELTATPRVGVHKYIYTTKENRGLLIDLQHRDEVLASSLEITGTNEISGMRRSRAWANDQHTYFVAQFSAPIESVDIYNNDTLITGKDIKNAEGKNLHALIRFKDLPGDSLIVKVGISGTDIQGARNNLMKEAIDKSFSQIKREADQIWEKELSCIKTEGGTKEQNIVFYTALYHMYSAPNVWSDVDGRYRGMDNDIHKADSNEQYTVFSLWDTYRAAHPLYTLFQPKRTYAFINTFLRQYKESGRLPVWELSANETNCMIGNHAIPVIVDAWAKDYTSFDQNLAMEAMVKSADMDHFGLNAYKKYGFIPADEEGESVSKTLEYAYDDWCISRFALARDDYETFQRFNNRAQSYKNLFDPSTGFFRARVNNQWFSPFDPTEVNFNYTEANAWQYSMAVPFDLETLIQMHGGSENFEKMLDKLFTTDSKMSGREQADITGLIGQYAQGNEPSHHMAYLYNFVGKPEKTQQLVRKIMDEFYTIYPDGLIGNEDCGQMSAWLVASAMGFYPVLPGTNAWVLGSPWFPKVTLNLPSGKKFVIKAENQSKENIYIASAKLNGDDYTRNWINNQTLIEDGELILAMTNQKGNKWGTAESDCQPSRIWEGLIEPVPVITKGKGAFKGSTTIEISSPGKPKAIYYTLDGSIPTIKSTLYTKPFAINKTTTVKAIATSANGTVSGIMESQFNLIPHNNLLTLQTKYQPQYAAGGDSALADGLKGGKNFKTGRWQGFEGTDVKAVMDLQEIKPINKVSVGFLQDQGAWVFYPKEVIFYASTDGKTFSPIGTVAAPSPRKADGVMIFDYMVQPKNTKARYISFKAVNGGVCPDWHPGKGGKTWIMADEFVIE